jgi:hypothetical protein
MYIFGDEYSPEHLLHALGYSPPECAHMKRAIIRPPEALSDHSHRVATHKHHDCRLYMATPLHQLNARCCRLHSLLGYCTRCRRSRSAAV